MPDVAAALIVVAGAILVLAGSSSSTLTDTARQRIVGLGALLAAVGLLAFLFAFAATFAKLLGVK